MTPGKSVKLISDMKLISVSVLYCPQRLAELLAPSAPPPPHVFPDGGNLGYIQTAIPWNIDAAGNLLPEIGARPVEVRLEASGLPEIGIHPNTMPRMGVPGPSLVS
jgi:hypothetical protein